MEVREGMALAVHGVVKGLAHRGVGGVTEAAPAPHARLILDVHACIGRGLTPVLAAEAVSGGLQAEAALGRWLQSLEADVLGQLCRLVDAARDPEVGLGVGESEVYSLVAPPGAGGSLLFTRGRGARRRFRSARRTPERGPGWGA